MSKEKTQEKAIEVLELSDSSDDDQAVRRTSASTHASTSRPAGSPARPSTLSQSISPRGRRKSLSATAKGKERAPTQQLRTLTLGSDDDDIIIQGGSAAVAPAFGESSSARPQASASSKGNGKEKERARERPKRERKKRKPEVIELISSEDELPATLTFAPRRPSNASTTPASLSSPARHIKQSPKPRQKTNASLNPSTSSAIRHESAQAGPSGARRSDSDDSDIVLPPPQDGLALYKAQEEARRLKLVAAEKADEQDRLRRAQEREEQLAAARREKEETDRLALEAEAERTRKKQEAEAKKVREAEEAEAERLRRKREVQEREHAKLAAERKRERRLAAEEAEAEHQRELEKASAKERELQEAKEDEMRAEELRMQRRISGMHLATKPASPERLPPKAAISALNDSQLSQKEDVFMAEEEREVEGPVPSTSSKHAPPTSDRHASVSNLSTPGAILRQEIGSIPSATSSTTNSTLLGGNQPVTATPPKQQLVSSPVASTSQLPTSESAQESSVSTSISSSSDSTSPSNHGHFLPPPSASLARSNVAPSSGTTASTVFEAQRPTIVRPPANIHGAEQSLLLGSPPASGPPPASRASHSSPPPAQSSTADRTVAALPKRPTQLSGQTTAPASSKGPNRRASKSSSRSISARKITSPESTPAHAIASSTSTPALASTLTAPSFDRPLSRGASASASPPSPLPSTSSAPPKPRPQPPPPTRTPLNYSLIVHPRQISPIRLQFLQGLQLALSTPPDPSLPTRHPDVCKCVEELCASYMAGKLSSEETAMGEGVAEEMRNAVMRSPGRNVETVRAKGHAKAPKKAFKRIGRKSMKGEAPMKLGRAASDAEQEEQDEHARDPSSRLGEAIDLDENGDGDGEERRSGKGKARQVLPSPSPSPESSISRPISPDLPLSQELEGPPREEAAPPPMDVDISATLLPTRRPKRMSRFSSLVLESVEMKDTEVQRSKSASPAVEASRTASPSSLETPPPETPPHEVEPAAMTGEDIIAKWIEVESKEGRLHRQIAGPPIPGEFNAGMHDQFNHGKRDFFALYGYERPDQLLYRDAFQNMVDEELMMEVPREVRSTVTIEPKKDPVTGKYLAPFHPPFEFYYTQRVVYAPGIAPVQSPGCDCEGDCGDPENLETCACRKRQIRACKSADEDKMDGHSNLDGFAYDRYGRVSQDFLGHEEPIWECNTDCGCPPGCINRVVGAKKGISVEIFNTDVCGWSVRLPDNAAVVKTGTPLAVYAGELIPSVEGDERDKVYRHIGRTYVYDLDSWTIEESVKRTRKEARLEALEAELRSARRRKGRGKLARAALAALEAERNADDDDDDFECAYALDAFHYGNWTRFCNHVCTGANAGSRMVYVDEGDVRRPLDVYFALRDINPGDEIFISYYSNSDAELAPKQTPADYQAQANEARSNADPWVKCYCGRPLCRGVMFEVVTQSVEESS